MSTLPGRVLPRRLVPRRLLPRLGQYALVLWVAGTINFLLPHLAPGDPIAYRFSPEGGLADEGMARLREQYGLDGSLLEQYGHYWAGVATGDLGRSIGHSRPVLEVLAERLPWTLVLVGGAIIASTVVGVLLGVLAARWRDKRRGTGLVSVVLAVDAMPGFWIAMILISIFAVSLGWFPTFGAVPVTVDSGVAWLAEAARHLVLPLVTLTVATLGSVFLLTRAQMLDALASAYVRHARAKGVTGRRLVLHHALRNAILPVFTHVMMAVGVLVSGSVVVEAVFGYPGLGELLYSAVLERDYPLLQGGFLLITLGVILANLIADVCYPLLDPRVRAPAEAEA